MPPSRGPAVYIGDAGEFRLQYGSGEAAGVAPAFGRSTHVLVSHQVLRSLVFTMPSNSNATLDALQQWFGDCPFAIVAFSGGVDSSVVSFLANRFLGSERNLSVISDSPSLKRSELQAAIAFCRRYQIPLEVIATRELDDPRYASNPSNRCFYCKQTLYRELQPLASRHNGSWILNGTNVDDLADYRPGLPAADQFQVRSPLAECRLTKTSVRDLAAALELECWNKPASPCLSSRIAYGQPVTEHKLQQIEEAEAILSQAGFTVVRFRHFGWEGRIEVPAEDLPRLKTVFAALEPSLRRLGFDRVIIDEEGFVSGKLNRVLAELNTNLPIL